MQNTTLLKLFSCLLITNVTWAYPPVYETVLQKTHAVGNSVWYFIPEDIQQAFISESATGYFGQILYAGTQPGRRTDMKLVTHDLHK